MTASTAGSATADVERLVDRLAQAPAVFSSPVDPAKPDGVRIEAVIADLFRARATRPLEPAEVADFRFMPAGRRHLQLLLVASWLLHDESLGRLPVEPLLALFRDRLRPLAELVMARLFVEDAERREELVRTCLAALAIAPAGELPAVSEDRLTTLDSVRREGLLDETKQREEKRQRARQKDLEKLRKQEEENRRKAARATFED